MSSSSDEAVRGTNTSATECKACAVKLGYYDDPFIHHFVNTKGIKLVYGTANFLICNRLFKLVN